MKRIIVIILLITISLLGCSTSKDKQVSQLEQANSNLEKLANQITSYEQQLSTLTTENNNLLNTKEELDNTIEKNSLIIKELEGTIKTLKNNTIQLNNEIKSLKSELELNKQQIEYEMIDGYKIPIQQARTYYAFSNEEAEAEGAGGTLYYHYDAWEIRNGEEVIINNIKDIDNYWYAGTNSLPLTINLKGIVEKNGTNTIYGLVLYNGARDSIEDYKSYGSVKKAILYVNSIPNAVLYFDDAIGRQEVKVDIDFDPGNPQQIQFKIVEIYSSINQKIAISNIKLMCGR